jgi:hypothetical protein
MRSAPISASLTFAAALLTMPVLAQDSKPTGSPDQIKKDLLEIERQIGRANFECDYKYFDRIEAEEFFFTGPSGDNETKQQDMAGEKDCHKFGGTYDLDETRISVYGNSAVVTARVTISGKNKEGKDFTHRSRFTDVFVWRDGRWQIVAGHSSKIPETAK